MYDGPDEWKRKRFDTNQVVVRWNIVAGRVTEQISNKRKFKEKTFSHISAGSLIWKSLSWFCHVLGEKKYNGNIFFITETITAPKKWILEGHDDDDGGDDGYDDDWVDDDHDDGDNDGDYYCNEYRAKAHYGPE